jgi:formiminoglutamase
MDMAPPFEWSGRVDAEETGVTTRWHQHVRAATSKSTGGVTLIGFAVDEGVRRNGGRPGAARGPVSLRHALCNLPVLGEPAVWDAGDVSGGKGGLEDAQTRLAARVAQAIQHKSLPLVLGGGHEMAWGTFQGIVKKRPDTNRLLVVNLDAHFDLRTAAQANSGTPFRQMHDWCVQHQQAFNYRALGISRFANTKALFDRARQIGARYWLDEHLQDAGGVHDAQQALSLDLAQCDAVYLTVCLDVLPGAQAPGVSAPATLGVPLAHVERLIDQVMASGRVVAADIAELCPVLDRDCVTSRLAARLAARIARGAT